MFSPDSGTHSLGITAENGRTSFTAGDPYRLSPQNCRRTKKERRSRTRCLESGLYSAIATAFKSARAISFAGTRARHQRTKKPGNRRRFWCLRHGEILQFFRVSSLSWKTSRRWLFRGLHRFLTGLLSISSHDVSTRRSHTMSSRSVLCSQNILLLNTFPAQASLLRLTLTSPIHAARKRHTKNKLQPSTIIRNHR